MCHGGLLACSQVINLHMMPRDISFVQSSRDSSGCNMKLQQNIAWSDRKVAMGGKWPVALFTAVKISSLVD
jgi:hypothetical protein